MLTWAVHQDEYLDEMLRLEGRGYSAIYSTCGGCQRPNPAFRCEQQMCYGPSLYCQTCIVKRHAALPTHWVEVREELTRTLMTRLTQGFQKWNGTFFERQDLKSLGLVIQLGHPVGYNCPNPLKANKGFVLIDFTGVHIIDVNFCQCDGRLEKRQQLMRVRWWPATARDPQTCATFGLVRFFQILNCQGKVRGQSVVNVGPRLTCLRKVSSHDFLRSLELLTNNDGLNPVPVRMGRSPPELY
jgi:hypothetical protein